MNEVNRATLYPVLPLRDIVVFPHMIVPLFVGREKSVRALEDVMKDDKQSPARDPEECRPGRSAARRHLYRRHHRHRAAAPEAARRHREGADRGRPARPHLQLAENAALLPGLCRARRRQRQPGQGGRGARPLGRLPVRAVHQAQQEDPAGGAGLDQPDRGPEQARRHGRLPPRPEDRREAGAAGDRRASSSGWSASSPSWKARSACCRWRSASAAASSARWRRPSASTI